MSLVIIRKTEDMIAYGYICIKYFPKSERFVLGADIRSSMLDLLGLMVGSSKKYYKKTALQNVDVELEKLRGLIRIAKDLGFLSFKRYENWSRYLVEIGNMLGGWLKSVK